MPTSAKYPHCTLQLIGSQGKRVVPLPYIISFFFLKKKQIFIIERIFFSRFQNLRRILNNNGGRLFPKKPQLLRDERFNGALKLLIAQLILRVQIFLWVFAPLFGLRPTEMSPSRRFHAVSFPVLGLAPAVLRGGVDAGPILNSLGYDLLVMELGLR